MKYTNEVEINQPLDKVIELLDSTDNLKYWQKGFLGLTHISGEPGAVGAKSRLNYQWGKREIEMIETITFKDLPGEFHLTYDTKGAHNIQKNYFTEQDGKTKWVSEAEFQFAGFMKVIAFFMGSKAFWKQSQIYLEDFKSFAEGNPKYGIEES